MGFDLYGERPKNKNGEYFRNNVWWWRPLWSYVATACNDILTKQDLREGSFNNGHWIRATKARALAERLTELLQSGHARDYEKKYLAALKALPLEQCEHCKGTGQRNDTFVKGKCNGCNGRGKKPAFETNYPFSEANVREFAQFCKDSGGFRIH